LPAELLQFLGSLAAIAMLVLLVWRLGLGKGEPFASEEQVEDEARGIFGVVEARRIAIDRDDRAALVETVDGRILLIRRHGAQIAGRELTGRASSQLAEGELTIRTAERRFGSAVLKLDDAPYWARRIAALQEDNHARA
jgi:hypothetical protein